MQSIFKVLLEYHSFLKNCTLEYLEVFGYTKNCSFINRGIIDTVVFWSIKKRGPDLFFLKLRKTRSCHPLVDYRTSWSVTITSHTAVWFHSIDSFLSKACTTRILIHILCNQLRPIKSPTSQKRSYNVACSRVVISDLVVQLGRCMKLD